MAKMNNSMPMQRKRSERKKRSLMLRFLVLPILSFQTACAGGNFEGCPAISQYSNQTEAQADHDLSLLPPHSPIRDFMKDYSVLRSEVRACRDSLP